MGRQRDGWMDRWTSRRDGQTDPQTDKGDSIRPSVGKGSDEWADRQMHRQKDNNDFIGPFAGQGPIKAWLQLPSVSSPATKI